ncbi:MAG: hypothetical protein VX836_18370 [Pseudomonadota bacterium]|nr:hypothetical protein [Pseudomonadota bacterium]
MIAVYAPNGVDEARQRVRDAVTATIPNSGSAATVLVAVEMLERAIVRAAHDRMQRELQTRAGGLSTYTEAE